MTRFHGKVGYGTTVEESPGVFVDQIAEYTYFGDVVRNSRKLTDDGEDLNKDLSVGNAVSIVADPYAREHFSAIRYVEWLGTLWTIAEVEVRVPVCS